MCDSVAGGDGPAGLLGLGYVVSDWKSRATLYYYHNLPLVGVWGTDLKYTHTAMGEFPIEPYLYHYAGLGDVAELKL